EIRKVGIKSLKDLSLEAPDYTYPQVFEVFKQVARSGDFHDLGSAGMSLRIFRINGLPGSESAPDVFAEAMGSPDPDKRKLARLGMNVYASKDDLGADWEG